MLNFVIVDNNKQFLLSNSIFIEKLILRYLLINKETSKVVKIS